MKIIARTHGPGNAPGFNKFDRSWPGGGPEAFLTVTFTNTRSNRGLNRQDLWKRE